ncbi:hypothetical protein AAVH_39618, partial [Aphelenchoides avenae]
MRDGWWYASPTDGIEAAPRAEPEDQLDAAPIVLQSTDAVRDDRGLAVVHGDAPSLNHPLEVQLDAKMLRAVIKWCDFHR